MNANNIIIRPIEEKDKPNYLRLFNEETFGCIGTNETQKPSIYEEEKIVDSIINNENIRNKILIIEKENQFLGYALIEKIDAWEYHIGEFVIEQSQRNQGYGSYLLETIKYYADSEGCNISLECLSSAQSFFSNHGFKKSEINFKYETSNYKEQTTQSPIFLDYEQIKKENEAEDQKRIKEYKKFLSSQLAKDIFNML